MKKLLTFLFLITIAAPLRAQLEEPLNRQAQDTSEAYPVHVSDLLNYSADMEELRRNLERHVPLRRSKKSPDEVGSTKEFFVYNFEDESFIERNFKLMRKGQVSQVWFEVAEIENGHLSEEVADSIFKSLEEKSNPGSFDPEAGIVELSNRVLGNPPNYDGDGLVDFLVTDIKDGWEPGNGYTAGFFFGADQYPDSLLVADPSFDYRSNERDILYIDSYPGIYRSSGVDPTRVLGILAHEYQHLIHFNYNAETPEYTFINEAQSNFASLLNGYFPHSSYGTYLKNTNVPIFRWNRDDVLPDYGRAASFSSYLWDQLGFEHAGHLTQSTLNGVAGIEFAIQQSGSDLEFGELLVNWGIANLINERERTGNSAYGYEHPFLRNLTVSDLAFDDPDVSGDTVGVKRGGMDYMAFQQVKNLTITVDYGNNPAGEVRIVMDDGNEITVEPLESGIPYTTPVDQEYETVYLVFVNTQPSSNGNTTGEELPFMVQVTGGMSANLESLSTYGSAGPYWAIPYTNNSGVDRLGFTNKYTIPYDATLHSTELYILRNDQQNINIKGEGKVRVALYTDNAGAPGSVMASDTVNFSELNTGWYSFDLKHLDISLQENQEIHIGYEMLVETINPDINSVPLRLDQNDGTQGVTYVMTSPDEFSPMFEEDNLEYGVFNNLTLSEPVTTTDNERNPSIPSTYTLEQNYPNPFNPSTNIEFAIPEASQVTLTVYNYLGQQVAQLVNSRLEAGSHTASWNAENMASGMYIYRLKAGDFNQTKKMILLK